MHVHGLTEYLPTFAPASTLDKDYHLALQTQFDLTREKTLHQQDTEDAALAAALELQDLEDLHGLGSIRLEVGKRWEGKTSDERKKIEESLHNLLKEPAVAGEYGPEGVPVLTDAHKYTRTFIRAGIPALAAIDDQFKLSSAALTPDQVLKEVLEFLEKEQKEIAESSKQNRDFLRINVDHIKTTFGHVTKNPTVDSAETNANAHHLLSRTWTLAKAMSRDYMSAIATVLSDNIGDQGSCIPGLIARLYARYAVMVGAQLGVTGSKPTVEKETTKLAAK